MVEPAQKAAMDDVEVIKRLTEASDGQGRSFVWGIPYCNATKMDQSCDFNEVI